MKTEAFDEAVKVITQLRGDDYGHPADDFARGALIKEAVKDCPDPRIRHALEMIGVKMCRLVHTPDHLDSVIDIAGYARTILMIVDRDEVEKQNAV